MRAKAQKHPRTRSDANKENPRMPKRLASLFALAVTATAILGALFAGQASAASPWWQVLDGSRPTHLWEGSDSVQEVTTEVGTFSEIEGILLGMEVEGELIGCLATEGILAEVGCPTFVHAPWIFNAAQLQTALEPVYGDEVEVSGGPVGGAPFIVTVPGRGVPTIGLDHAEEGKIRIGSGSTNVLSPGGSGRLLVTLTNLGDAPVDASSIPVTIKDELPEGAIATGVTATAGVQDTFRPVDCEVKAPDEALCGFEGTLPPYESIEVEVFTSLQGSPPEAGASGKITVSGGNAPTKTGDQNITVSPDPVPYGVERFSAVAEEEGGAVARQAGGHPFQFTTTVQLNSGAWTVDTNGNPVVEQPGLPRNLRFPLPSGQVGNATAMPQCSMEDFLSHDQNSGSPLFLNMCPAESALGVAAVTFNVPGTVGYMREAVPVFNLPPAFGEPARFGFMPGGDPVVIDTSLDPDTHKIIASVRNTTQVAQFLSSTLSLWGYPSDTRHDNARGWSCAFKLESKLPPCQRPSSLPETAFLRMPVNCNAPLDFSVDTEPWNVPIGSTIANASFQGDPLRGCQKVPFDPQIEAAPTSKLAENPSGLTFNLNMPNSGLLNPDATAAEGQPKKVEVTLPKGVTINPSQGDGLVGCSPAQYAAERFNSRPGEGCPEASKVGTVSVISPLLKEEATGALFIASPHDNPFNSLLGLYSDRQDPPARHPGQTGRQGRPRSQDRAANHDLRQPAAAAVHRLQAALPRGRQSTTGNPTYLRHLYRRGKVRPLVGPGPEQPLPERNRQAHRFVPDRKRRRRRRLSLGQHPALPSGTAGRHAQQRRRALLRLQPAPLAQGRRTGVHPLLDQAPPGDHRQAGRESPTARTPRSPRREHAPASTAARKSSTTQAARPHRRSGGPSSGAGVGSLLTYVPGKIYLAGPYNGAPISMVAITSGVVGPFDVGTVVIRQAFRIDPETAEVFIDSTSSDPIPHIIQGIPVHARDIRAYVDRPQFTLNPTSCLRTSTASTVLGSGLDFGSPIDDNPITVTSPFQAADCAALTFGPKLSLQLLGGTRRGAHPAFKATLKMHGFGEAAIEKSASDIAAFRVPRERPHQDGLHQGAVQSRSGQRHPVPGRLRLRLCQGDDADPRRPTHRTGLPADPPNTSCPTWSQRFIPPPGSTSTWWAGSTRSKAAGSGTPSRPRPTRRSRPSP